MTDKIYPYDKNLPYVVPFQGAVMGRFPSASLAGSFAAREGFEPFIDTTPAPRVPEDAEYILWWDQNACPCFAIRVAQGPKGWRVAYGFYDLEDLPGVTPDTVFTVLEERKS